MTDRVPPVRRQLVVLVSPDAFDAFTRDIGVWWPLQKSVYGEGSSVSFAGGRLVEEPSDRSAVWGTVLDWSPPDGFRMTWHPGYPDETVATEVDVRFVAVGDGTRTLVTLVHTGWERLAEPAKAREEYRGGWVAVLGGFESHFDKLAEQAGDEDKPDAIWLALSHTPGGDAPADGNVFADVRLRDPSISWAVCVTRASSSRPDRYPPVPAAA
ncbi:MAG TPA: SRPBCC domain-containing protein [Micromonosporaceae bacterium]|jgi:uncharacterized protein YndB with AHSA1/START domain